MKPTTLLVARQAGTQWHDNDQVIGKQNAELSQPGLERAERLAKLLEKEDIDIVYTSRLGRAVDTGKTIGKYHNLRVIPVAELDERGYGELEGKKRKDLEAELERLKKKDEQINGGESGHNFGKRVVGFVEKCVRDNAGKTILIVSHEGPVTVIQDYFTRFDNSKGDDDCTSSLAGLSEFEVKQLEPLQVAIKRWDEVNHLN